MLGKKVIGGVAEVLVLPVRSNMEKKERKKKRESIICLGFGYSRLKVGCRVVRLRTE